MNEIICQEHIGPLLLERFQAMDDRLDRLEAKQASLRQHLGRITNRVKRLEKAELFASILIATENPSVAGIFDVDAKRIHVQAPQPLAVPVPEPERPPTTTAKE